MAWSSSSWRRGDGDHAGRLATTPWAVHLAHNPQHQQLVLDQPSEQHVPRECPAADGGKSLTRPALGRTNNSAIGSEADHCDSYRREMASGGAPR